MTDPGRTSPLVEEAAKLATVLADWVRTNGPGALTTVAAALGSHVGGSPECDLCPFCQLLSLVRGSQPDAFAHLTDAAASLSAALTAFAETAGAQPAAKSPTVQHIKVG